MSELNVELYRSIGGEIILHVFSDSLDRDYTFEIHDNHVDMFRYTKDGSTRYNIYKDVDFQLALFNLFEEWEKTK